MAGSGGGGVSGESLGRGLFGEFPDADFFLDSDMALQDIPVRSFCKCAPKISAKKNQSSNLNMFSGKTVAARVRLFSKYPIPCFSISFL
jgi:hypothetical protein